LQPSTIVAIGASAGGVRALQVLASELDPSLPAAWCAVLHVDSHRSEMPGLLSRAGRIPAVHVSNGQRLEDRCIYVAPPDLHFMVEDGHAVLSRGPRENWARPAIDPLLRSAAVAYGPRAVGVVLTGNLNDGTAGLRAIKQANGVAVVQDPRDAEFSAMPRSALRHVAVDHCVPLAAMPALLSSLILYNAGVSHPSRAVGEDRV
jgi:two-component system, chemotaxis family, protein-glutamate methylesterase/glutaminase